MIAWRVYVAQAMPDSVVETTDTQGLPWDTWARGRR